jgi:hypothetical protein
MRVAGKLQGRLISGRAMCHTLKSARCKTLGSLLTLGSLGSFDPRFVGFVVTPGSLTPGSCPQVRVRRFVTPGSHLLDLKTFHSIEIVTAAAAVERIGSAA